MSTLLGAFVRRLAGNSTDPKRSPSQKTKWFGQKTGDAKNAEAWNHLGVAYGNLKRYVESY